MIKFVEVIAETLTVYIHAHKCVRNRDIKTRPAFSRDYYSAIKNWKKRIKNWKKRIKDLKNCCTTKESLKILRSQNLRLTIASSSNLGKRKRRHKSTGRRRQEQKLNLVSAEEVVYPPKVKPEYCIAKGQQYAGANSVRESRVRMLHSLWPGGVPEVAQGAWSSQ